VNPDITVVIADDHPIFRQGLRQVIERDPRLTIVAEAEDGDAAIETIVRLHPRVAVVDVRMPGRDGLEVARTIREKRLPTGMVILTMFKEARFFNAAMDVGVKGYVLKESAITEVVGCVKAVAAGETYISPQLSSLLLDRMRRAAQLEADTPGLASLTPTERRILKLVGEYKTSRQIADELCISVRTVDHHRANIGEKLELRGAHALVRFAVEHRSEL
jgi:DNA-binding NarL/FixJ family response regulator